MQHNPPYTSKNTGTAEQRSARKAGAQTYAVPAAFKQIGWLLGGLLLILMGWHWIALGYPAYILPSPDEVLARFLSYAGTGQLWRHTWTTLSEALLGLLLGGSLALVTGYLLAQNPTLERVISPYLAASQSVPLVALAPLLMLWIHPDYIAKIVICALVVVFPLLMTAIVAFRTVDPRMLDLLRSLGASRRQRFRTVELPSALPLLFGGFRASTTLAIIGAVVAEFTGAKAGLGFLVNQAAGLLDTPLLFVALVTLSVLGLGLYLAVTVLERILLPARKR